MRATSKGADPRRLRDEARIGDLFESNARERPDEPAVINTSGRVSWSELDGRARRAAEAFIERGVRPGDRVAIVLENGIDAVTALVACAYSGAVAVPLNVRLRRDDLRAVLWIARPSLAVVADDVDGFSFRDAVGDHLAADALIAGSAAFAAALERAPLAAPHGAARDDVAAVIFTSGSTGRPRGVKLTHRNLVWNAASIAISLDLDAADVILTAVPLAHVFGYSACLLTAAAAGAAIAIVPAFHAHDTLAFTERTRATVWNGVPTMFALALAAIDEREYDLAAVRTGIMAGAPCPPTLVRRVRARFCDVRVSYGLTEASPAVTMAYPSDSQDVRESSLGAVLPGVEVRIDADGELLVRGPNVFAGYENDDAATDAVLRDGELRTGDLVALDRGALRFVARKKELIVRGGYKIAPAEIEALLLELPWVASVCVVGVSDDVLGERICAAIVAREETPPDPLGDARAALSPRVASYKLPDRIAFFDALPLGPSGKLARDEVRRVVAGERSTASP